ncbi:MAG: glucose-6-phosphate dehydrogenase [Anaerolineae bacterium]|nr:glucose-6-phosphate dehydrogenase [Anaerolineae bacterium]
MTEEHDGAKLATVVIFGASGDLTQRKLIPALFNLYCKDRLPAEFNIVGFAHTGFSDEAFREHLQEGMQQFAAENYEAAAWASFARRLWYVPGSFDKPDDYAALQAKLATLEDGAADRLYYLATAPRFFPVIARQLGAAGMARSDQATRQLIVEKPFGSDLASARELTQALHEVFDEGQIYRIDHFLGKETAQNILFLRFANTLFELGWNRDHIANVQITVAEQVDVGHRAGYYDQAGILRDMFQNHLLQLLALAAMEPPISFAADAIRDEKVKLLASIRPIAPEDVALHTVRGQYEGYRDAPGVAADSQTATYAAVRLFIDNWRWQGVPFYLRSGKALAQKATEILVEFRCPPHLMFPLAPGQMIESNILSLCIQPDEGVHFKFQAKVPDTVAQMRPVNMEFHYDDTFGQTVIPDAYERLLFDAIAGDKTLFTRSDGIENAWRFIDPILEGWSSPAAPPLATYARDSWGPGAAEELLRQDGHSWLLTCGQHD